MTKPVNDIPLADRFIKAGVLYIIAFGGVLLALIGITDSDADANNALNLARILGNALPMGILCAAGLLATGLVLKWRGRTAS